MAAFLAEHPRVIALTLYLIAVIAVGTVVFWNAAPGQDYQEPL